MAKKKSLSKSNNKTEMELHKLAHYTFFVGILIAIVAGLFRSYIRPEVLVSTLVFLGFIVGLFNLTTKETQPFLLAAVALMLAGIVNLSLIPFIGPFLRSILNNIVVFVVPGAVIVGMKAIWRLASD
jgi:LytS/YehU family sensor histidine kinase